LASGNGYLRTSQNLTAYGDVMGAATAQSPSWVGFLST
jgi:hypothetical protein